MYRPTKLAEMYNELYDNEWTDAFEVLAGDNRSEEESLELLKLTLLVIRYIKFLVLSS